MREAKENFGCKVKAVVTDNENKMKAVRSSLKEDDPDLNVYGCSSHWLNLLGQDITETRIISQVVEVNKYFRNHHIPGSLTALNDLSSPSSHVIQDGTVNSNALTLT